MKYIEGLAGVTNLFVTGLAGEDRAADQAEALGKMVRGWGIESVQFRRMSKEDMELRKGEGRKWYICANNPLTKSSTEWLEGDEVEYEYFDY